MSERFIIILTVILQLIACLFFLGQILLGLAGISLRPLPWQLYEVLEILSGLALLAGVIIGILLYRRSQKERHRIQTALRHASTAFGEVLVERFAEWGLSVAERDVAMFLIKGSSTTEIAQMRNTSEGTIKAQNASIYRKAGVTGKTQLLSLFVEDLFEEK